MLIANIPDKSLSPRKRWNWAVKHRADFVIYPGEKLAIHKPVEIGNLISLGGIITIKCSCTINLVFAAPDPAFAHLMEPRCPIMVGDVIAYAYKGSVRCTEPRITDFTNTANVFYYKSETSL